MNQSINRIVQLHHQVSILAVYPSRYGPTIQQARLQLKRTNSCRVPTARHLQEPRTLVGKRHKEAIRNGLGPYCKKKSPLTNPISVQIPCQTTLGWECLLVQVEAFTHFVTPIASVTTWDEWDGPWLRYLPSPQLLSSSAPLLSLD